MAETPASPEKSEKKKKLSFAALRHPGCRVYLIGAALAMMADNIEHVISYWIIFQKFHSPALGGFAIVAHWLPFLLFSVYSGALADRFDPRRIIQIGMGLFIIASTGWGVLFFTDSLEMWHAALLLVIHGLAGVLWSPAAQLLVHHMVGGDNLQSAIRLMAISRNLGQLFGPAIGAALLLSLGSAMGIIVNALIYLPLLIWLIAAPYGPQFSEGAKIVRRGVKGFGEIFDAIRGISSNYNIVAMVLLAGGTSMFVGNAHSAQMPEFAADLGAGKTGILYSILLAANAAGALIGGIILETRGWLQPKPRTAIFMGGLWAIALGGFAITGNYVVAVALIFIAGFLNLSFSAMAQTLTQLEAPPEIRGRVIGLYNMSNNGLRTFSGVTVGIGGGAIGIHWSLGLSAVALVVFIAGLMVYTNRPQAVPAE
ncbi:MAG: MFS transporter [Rhodospirillales bacterium]|jgi:MFS family permease|nr:MFS transporter [Rhodospirillales bacterium]MBT5075816.1 MFS transporter [Rhodospirillales bacterium]MBT5113883.1 MFS transporter [Rhodospirillales bacterium]MBT5672411.1 MFS transporter [Rhodospirillales bacterium]MBT6185920.1 MFS transporter [Rhodospirillales bacterium]